MKTAYYLTLTCLFLYGLPAYSQENNNYGFRLLGVRYDNANVKRTSATDDSVAIVTCVIEILDTTSVNTLHVKISNDKKRSGNLFKSSYGLRNTAAVKTKNEFQVQREGRIIYVPTVKTKVLSEYTVEISAEDTNGKMSPYLKLNQ